MHFCTVCNRASNMPHLLTTLDHFDHLDYLHHPDHPYSINHPDYPHSSDHPNHLDKQMNHFTVSKKYSPLRSLNEKKNSKYLNKPIITYDLLGGATCLPNSQLWITHMVGYHSSGLWKSTFGQK